MGVALEAFAGDGGKAGQAGVAYLAEVLARLDGTDVDLHRGDGDGLEGVQDGNAGVRVGCRVDHNAVDLAVCLLDLVDDAALVVGLEDLDLVKALRGAGLLADLDQAVVVVAAVDARLANAEHVEVGSVDDESFHGCFLCDRTELNGKPPQRCLSPLWWFLLESGWEGVEEGSGGVGCAVARVDDVVCPGAVARHALLDQLVDAVAGSDGATLVGELIELTVEHHNLTVLVQQRVILVARDHAAAGGEHQAAALGEVGQSRRFLLAEGRLAAFDDKVGARHAQTLLEGAVQVDVLAAGEQGDLLTHAGFARARHADQGDVLLAVR